MKAVIKIIILIFYHGISIGQEHNNTNNNSGKPFILGTIYEIESKVLNEKRILNVYLPDGYNKEDSVTYPVIYLLDGSSDEDFIHIVGLVQYHSFEWVNNLPKSIVVGIATVDRKRDFTFPTKDKDQQKAFPSSGYSGNFIRFIETELQPFIENQFGPSQSRTLIGQSLGGLLATEILFTKPDLFNNYIIVSPSLWWNNGSLLQDNIPSSGLIDQEMAVYIGVGKEGLTPGKTNRVMEVDANMLADKLKSHYNNTNHVIFDYLPQEDHATIMHQAVSNAFKMIKSSRKK